ncbi:MAG: HypC/HybG/HupF family hydrogenase formation chaperone [Fibrobacterota bacterium]
MCLSIPGKILTMKDGWAEVDINGAITRARIDLLENLKAGDYVLVHAGFAIQRYDREDAEKTLELFREMADDKRL